MTLAELELDLEEGGWPTAAGAGLALGQVTWNDALQPNCTSTAGAGRVEKTINGQLAPHLTSTHGNRGPRPSNDSPPPLFL